MRLTKQVALVVGLLVVVFAGAGGVSASVSSPIRRVSVGQFRPILPLDSRTANQVVRVVFEHHKDNLALDVSCEGEETFVASSREVAGKAEGVAEELFPFNLTGGSYVCEAALFRGDSIFRQRTAQFLVASKE